MTGITRFGSYVPYYRLAHRELARAWGGRGGDAERAVANVDEDSITMAVEAVRDLLNGQDPDQVDGLLFSTTTSPYSEKQASTLIATAADLRPDIRTGDQTNSLRAGMSALRTALDMVAAGSASNVIVASADTRLSPPRSAGERMLGDAASALEVGKHGVIARLVGAHSVSEEITDVWRRSGDRFVTGWEERFAITQGYQRIVTRTVSELFERSAIGPREIAKAVFYAPDPGSLGGVARALGLGPDQVPDHFFSSIGSSGTPMPFLVLSSVLAELRPGDRCLVVGYGQGCDALLFEATEEIERARELPRRGVQAQIESKGYLDSYERYARFRDLIDAESARREAPGASATDIWRRSAEIYRFHGFRCLSCGAIQYPRQRLCMECRSRDNFETVRLSEKPATLFTFTLDYLNVDADPPTVMCVVDFEGGGRAYVMMTDRDPSKVKIDQPVEMTFRRVYEAEGFNNYYWKCRPVR